MSYRYLSSHTVLYFISLFYIIVQRLWSFSARNGRNIKSFTMTMMMMIMNAAPHIIKARRSNHLSKMSVSRFSRLGLFGVVLWNSKMQGKTNHCTALDLVLTSMMRFKAETYFSSVEINSSIHFSRFELFTGCCKTTVYDTSSTKSAQ